MNENNVVDEAEGKTVDQFTFRPGKSTAHGAWQAVLGLVQMKKLKGKFWMKSGFTVNGVDFLYPEEALSLYERKLLSIDWQDGRMMNKKELFEVSLGVIPLAVYLVYAKLKALEYIILRHNKGVRVFSCDNDVKAYLSSHPTHSLLDSMVSYAIYIDAQNFSKKAAKTLQPLHYVVIVDGPLLFNPRITQQLLKEAQGVSVIFAVVTSTLNVILQEFVDADQSLKVENLSDRGKLSKGARNRKEKHDRSKNKDKQEVTNKGLNSNAGTHVDAEKAAEGSADVATKTVPMDIDVNNDRNMDASLDILLDMDLDMDMSTIINNNPGTEDANSRKRKLDLDGDKGDYPDTVGHDNGYATGDAIDDDGEDGGPEERSNHCGEGDIIDKAGVSEGTDVC